MRLRSQQLADSLSVVESPGVTTIGEGWPVFWDHAHGATVVDVDGNSYIDLTAAFGVMSVGHSNPRVTEAIANQAAQLIHGMGDVHPTAVKVAFLEALSALCPAGLDRAILGLNGSDAVEAAIKCAQLVTGRSGLIAFEGAYHGLSYGALSVTSRQEFRAPFAGRVGGATDFVSYPTNAADVEPALQQIRSVASTGKHGAVIVEPIQGRGGVRVPADGFMTALRRLCDEFEMLLIVDEIFTGLGRTGRWFAVDYEGVIPDLMCLGKALGGGMPVSACVGGATSIDQWPKATGEALHTSTFLGHPVSCAAGLAAIHELKAHQLPARAARLGALVLERLQQAPVVAVRGRGLMIGVELETGARAAKVVARALDKGLLLLPSGADGHVLSLTPPLVIADDLLNRALDIVISCLRETP